MVYMYSAMYTIVLYMVYMVYIMVLYYIVSCYVMLFYTALRCIALHHSILHYNVSSCTLLILEMLGYILLIILLDLKFLWRCKSGLLKCGRQVFFFLIDGCFTLCATKQVIPMNSVTRFSKMCFWDAASWDFQASVLLFAYFDIHIDVGPYFLSLIELVKPCFLNLMFCCIPELLLSREKLWKMESLQRRLLSGSIWSEYRR